MLGLAVVNVFECISNQFSIQAQSGLNQRSHALGDLSPDSLNVIANSRMDAKHDHLNDLLDG